MTKTTTGAHRAISHSSWQTTTPKIVKTKQNKITMRDFTSMFPPFPIAINTPRPQITLGFLEKNELRKIDIQSSPDLRYHCVPKKHN